MLNRPKDIEAERGIIKTALLRPDFFEQILNKVSGKMFDDINNQLVFNTLQTMHNDGVYLETVALKGYLSNSLDRIGGDDYFETLEESDALPVNLDKYIQSVRDSFILRTVIDYSLDLAETSIRQGNPNDAISKFLRYADDIANELGSDNLIIPLDDLAAEMYSRLIKRLENPGFQGIPVGLYEFDHVIGGVEPTHLWYIAARPGMGKTSLLLSILMNMARQGVPVLFFSYEMSPEQIFNRLLSMHSGVSYGEIRTGHFENSNQQKVEHSFGIVSALPFYMTYSTSMSVDEIRNLTTKMVRQKGVQVAALDYVQLLCGSNESANAQLTYISRMLKLSALKDNISWLAASQLNRNVEMRDNKRPRLSDLRDSGSLEQDADVVAMLYREYMYNPIADLERQCELLIRKNRHGPIGDFLIDFDKATMTFR